MIRKNKKLENLDNVKLKPRILGKSLIDKCNFKATKMPLMIAACVIAGFIGCYIYQNFFNTKILKSGYTISNVNIKENSSITTTAKKVMPAVVSITGVTHTQSFLGNTDNSEVAGTGYIVRSDGLIVTNKHVVSNTSADYTVITNDGKSYSAIVKSTDPMFDIAIIKIDGTDLPIV